MTNRPKMAVRVGSPAGIETDGKGNFVPFEERTLEDKEAVQEAVVKAMHGGSVKDPEGEAEAPAPMPTQQQGQGGEPSAHDLAGNQGGQRGGGPDLLKHS